MKVKAADLQVSTVEGFGREWTAYDQTTLSAAEQRELFDRYFSSFPLKRHWEGFDLGCGSGRWAELVAPQVKRLHCIDPSAEALAVTRAKRIPNAVHHLACAETITLPNASQDFGYCLGVLHHVPNTQAAMTAAVRKLKPGAPFLLYLYYALDDRPAWFRALWRVSDLLRRVICRLPFGVKVAVTVAIAALVYWPLARLSAFTGTDLPLSAYARSSFYSMRTDALDRFGTRLEKRFTRAQVIAMMERAGLTNIRVADTVPKWVAIGHAVTFG
jgi:ubiquinone/menaquinone biosynthesis C-methylase UbiE